MDNPIENTLSEELNPIPLQCIHCGAIIPPARLKILPKVKSCVQCSQTARVHGFPIISGKNSYSEIQLVSESEAERLFKLQDRKGSIAEGVKFKQLPPPKVSNLDFE